MSLEYITELYIPVVMVACLVLGVILKKWCPADNKWIPTILVVFGAVLGCVANTGITLDYIVAGAVTGLASTGLHQAFKQLIEKDTLASTEKGCLNEAEAEAMIQADIGEAIKKEASGADKAEG